ncbi:MAG: ATP-binding protein [Planctomycetota bacterium]
MSLRTRLLLVLVMVNLALLGAAQLTSWGLQRRWLDQNRRVYEERIHDRVLRSAFAADHAGPGTTPNAFLRRLLTASMRDQLRPYFRDAILSAKAADGSETEIAPLGATLRDPATFPLAEIRRGIQDAAGSRSLVRAGSGFCLAIVSAGEVVGGAWFEPVLPPPPQIPTTVFALPLLSGTVLFGLFAYLLIGRQVARPLRVFGATAKSFGEGRYDLRMPTPRDRELAVFSDAFNAMAARIEGHHDELAREVQRATEDAKRGERAMLQSARLAAMGTLAAGIAHEINNPIGGMLNAVRWLTAREGLSEKERTYLGLVKDGLERVARIARRVLDFSPKQTESVPFRLLDAVDGARALVDHRMRQVGVEFVLDVDPALPSIPGDRHEFQQVLLNLFLNSLDAFEGHKPPYRIRVHAFDDGTRITIEVGDNGPGMPAELLARVMDPFFTRKQRPDASGLGMFISYSIVRNQGGEMEVESRPGEGFLTRIRLPRPN